MKKILILIIPVIFFVRCFNPSYKAEVKNIDSLSMTLSKSEIELKKVDTILIENKFKKFVDNMKLLEKLNSKKMKDDEKIAADEYRLLGGDFFKQYRMNMKNLQFEINKSKNQLENLKNDLINGRIAKSTYDGYLKIEKKKAEEINEETEKYSERTEGYINKFEALNTKIEKLLEKK